MGDEEGLGTSMGDAPDVPAPGGDADELTRRCAEERETMKPHETADCAGAELSELYENEEDGGS